MRKISIYMTWFCYAFLYGQTSPVTIQTVSNYNQWKWDTTYVMKNGLITMATVPAIGGRVMQYDLGILPSMMVNAKEFGNTYTPASGGYHNFGGFKNWPSPQNVWPGTWPPPPILDYAAYTVLETSQTVDSVSISIVSPIEKWVAPNIQFKRRATIFPGTSRVRMEQTIVNKGIKDTSWGMWSIVQTIVNHTGKMDTANYWAYFPINPKSIFGASGAKPDYASKAWKGVVAPGVYGVQFVADSKKIFADPDRGWIVYSSVSDTVVFARTFPIFEGMKYPDGGARTTVYVSASSTVDPLYMEVEVKSPVVLLAANGGSYTFTENWWAAKVRAPIVDVNTVGAVAQHISFNSATRSFSASYGVFHQGTAQVVILDDHGQSLAQSRPIPVSPLNEFLLQESLTIPDSAKKIAILIYNTTGQFIGTLDSVNMSNLSTGITETSTQPFQFILEQNYPNPFNPNTTIGYELPVRSSVKFSIYDILGREVKLVNWTVQSAGHHSIRWNGMDQYDRPLPSGMYVYRLSSRSLEDERAFDKAAKMVLVK